MRAASAGARARAPRACCRSRSSRASGPSRCEPQRSCSFAASFALLVRADRDVLGAVVGGDVRRHEAQGPPAQSRAGRWRAPAPPGRGSRARRALTTDGAAEHRPKHRRALERQPCLREGMPDLRDDRHGVGRRAGPRRSGLSTFVRPLNACGWAATFSLSVIRANRAGPGRGPVHEHAVGEGHAAQPELFFRHADEGIDSESNSANPPAQASMDLAACRRKLTPSSRSSTGTRSSAEWIRRAASLGVHHPQREEAVGNRAESLAEPVAVGEARDADRCGLRAPARPP